ncbi:MAG: hypothetical protein FDZ70_03075 [Actinobacteria bacterium]|nr:MAG: hypothetical protein FDZ70_03075 [Actinomycetota bacterium]
MRSELFWLETDILDPRHVLLYTRRAEPRLQPREIATLAERHVAVVATRRAAAATGVPLYRPGAGTFALAVGLGMWTLAAAAAAVIRLAPPAPGHVAIGLSMVAPYASWRRFFERNRVGVHFDIANFDKAGSIRNAAIEHAGGVSVAYQWSNLGASPIETSCDPDVFFQFGPAYDDVFARMGSAFGRTVYSGYVTDHAFAPVRGTSAKLRASLEERGARFVVAYLDEATSDAPMSCMTDAEGAAIYADLMQRVLDDPEFAVVFKPGYPLSIDERLRGISELRERAEATGRCVFVSEGSFLTTQYPTMVAQAADLAIGLLGSGTVGLESWLSGVRTVFLNIGPRMGHLPLAFEGAGTTVFDSVGELLAAVDRFRSDPAQLPGLGDLTAWAEGRDPYRDGRASERISGYLALLLESLGAGEGREGALAAADAAYRIAWGDDAVAVRERAGA